MYILPYRISHHISYIFRICSTINEILDCGHDFFLFGEGGIFDLWDKEMLVIENKI